DEKRVRLACVEHGQRALQARAVQRLRALAGIDDDFDQVQLAEFSVGLQLRALRVEANSAVGLLVGRDSQVGDGLGRHESDVRSLAGRVKEGARLSPEAAFTLRRKVAMCIRRQMPWRSTSRQSASPRAGSWRSLRDPWP